MSEKVIEKMLRGEKKSDNTSLEPENNRPEPGSAEEAAFLEAAWQQPEIRAALFAKHGPQLEAMGYKPDGTLPADAKMPVIHYSYLFVDFYGLVTSVLQSRARVEARRGGSPSFLNQDL
jgi:hypothetical protein